MVTAVIIALWVIAMALAWAWLAGAAEAVDPAGCTDVDPYSAEVAAFRAELHNWDRGAQ